jgi:uncharacterized protein YkwD
MRISIFLTLLIFTACGKSVRKNFEEALSGAKLIPDISLPDSKNPPLSDGLEVFESEFLTLVNAHRRSLGASPLTYSKGLGEIASLHSLNMANKTVDFGHTGFSGRCADARVALGGGNLCAENVAMGQKDAKSVFTSWMNSSGHRANIENPRHTHTGLGMKKSASGSVYWTQILMEKN